MDLGFKRCGTEPEGVQRMNRWRVRTVCMTCRQDARRHENLTCYTSNLVVDTRNMTISQAKGFIDIGLRHAGLEPDRGAIAVQNVSGSMPAVLVPLADVRNWRTHHVKSIAIEFLND